MQFCVSGLHALQPPVEFKSSSVSNRGNVNSLPTMASHVCTQALLRAALRVHGESVSMHAPLRERAARIEAKLRATWTRLDDLMQGVRCMVGFFSNMQS